MQNRGIVFMGMGFELVVMLLGAICLGQAIDRYYAWPGYAAASLIIIFMCLWIFHLIKLLSRVMAQEEKDREKK